MTKHISNPPPPLAQKPPYPQQQTKREANMENGDLPAMPSGVLQDGHNCGEYPLNTGLTKREQFAMAAMQGLLAKYGVYSDAATDAVRCADALLAELERTK